MIKVKIKDEKVFVTFIAVLVFVGILSFLAYKIVQFKKGNSAATQDKNAKQIAFGTRSATNAGSAGNVGGANSGAAIAQTEYVNQTYQYKIAYPDNWYINIDSAETKQAADNSGKAKQVTSGGQAFWSNYKNIDDFSPDRKPADFHLLGLTVYEAAGLDSDAIAAFMGIDTVSILKTQTFAAKGISGKEYIAAGEDDKNPLVVIIFQKGQRFFVFNLGFVNGSAAAATTMENIVKNFSL